MRSAPISRTISLPLIGQVAVAIVLAWLTNLFVESSIARFREGRISREASRDTRALEAEISSLDKSVQNLRVSVTRSCSLHIPSAKELKDLTAKHKLRIRRMEKQTRAAQAGIVGRDTYSIVCVGSVIDQVAFLRELETIFLMQSDNVVLQRYNDDGSLVALGLTLEMNES